MSARVRVARTDELETHTLDAFRALNEAAHGHSFIEDWDHALGGVHLWIAEDGVPVSHASVVARDLHVRGVALPAGYVEAVATRPDRQRRGHGTAVMRAAGAHVAATFEIGALSTGMQGFYERLGWETWRGPTFVRIGIDIARTPREDGGIMVLRTPSTPDDLDLDAPIACEWRAGDVW